MPKHEQIDLFTQKLESADLVAIDNPRKAFYKIWIEKALDNYKIVKESGIKGRVLDRRSWPCHDLEEAEKGFRRRINAKTNPDRKSPRIYQLISGS